MTVASNLQMEKLGDNIHHVEIISTWPTGGQAKTKVLTPVRQQYTSWWEWKEGVKDMVEILQEEEITPAFCNNRFYKSPPPNSMSKDLSFLN